jgi:hypothetical protein
MTEPRRLWQDDWERRRRSVEEPMLPTLAATGMQSRRCGPTNQQGMLLSEVGNNPSQQLTPAISQDVAEDGRMSMSVTSVAAMLRDTGITVHHAFVPTVVRTEQGVWTSAIEVHTRAP